MDNKQKDLNHEEIEETIESVKEALESDPLIVEPVLSNDELITTITHNEEQNEEVIPLKSKQVHVTNTISYIKNTLQAPFLTLTKVTDNQFPIAIGLFIASTLLVSSILFIFLSKILYATSSIFYGASLSFFSLAQTFLTIIFSVGLLQILFFLLFFILIKIQGGITPIRLLFSRYMHLSVVSIIGYIVTFLLALLSINVSLSILLLFSVLQLMLVSFLFFIEKREQQQLLDPIYNSLLFLVGVTFILSFVGAEIFSRYSFFW